MELLLHAALAGYWRAAFVAVDVHFEYPHGIPSPPPFTPLHHTSAPMAMDGFLPVSL